MAPRKNNERARKQTRKVDFKNGACTRSTKTVNSAVGKKKILSRTFLYKDAQNNYVQNVQNSGTKGKLRNVKLEAATTINRITRVIVNDVVTDADGNKHPDVETTPAENAASTATDKANELKQAVPLKDVIIHSETMTPPPNKKSKPTTKETKNEIKIQLANEVIRSVFQKKQTPVNIDMNNTVPFKGTQKKMRGRPKKNFELLNCGLELKTTPKSKDTKQQMANDTKKLTGTVGTPKTKGRLSLRRKSIIIRKKTINQTRSSKKKSMKEFAVAAPVQENTVDSITRVEISALECIPENNSETKSQNQGIIRKQSVTSTSTCFSWTKDISSSSVVSCVTVQSNDFVRFDKKLPFVKLTNIDHKVERRHSNDNMYDDSSPNNLQEHGSTRWSISNSELNVSQTLNLSTSSLTSASINRTTQNIHAMNKNKNDIVKNLRARLNKLSSEMKSFDLEIINWIRYNNEHENESTKDFSDRILNLLTEENDIMNYCKAIKKVLLDCNDSTKSSNIREISTSKHNSEKVGNITLETVTNDSTKEKDDTLEQEPVKRKDENSVVSSTDYNKTIEQRKSFDKDSHVDNNEDDDAISLFAESITCWETSKRNGPDAKSKDDVKNVTSTSKMNDVSKLDSHLFPRVTKTVYEKQKPDSSSGCKILNDTIFFSANNKPPPKPLDLLNTRINVLNNVRSVCTMPVDETDNYDNIANDCVDNEAMNSVEINSDRITETHFKSHSPILITGNGPILYTGTGIFKCCIFNLNSSCKKRKCNYPHISIEIGTVQTKLQELSEEAFIKECVYMLNWMPLKRKFGMCFVNECVRRDLTRLLIHIIINFLRNIKGKDRTYVNLVIEIVEISLLHLNNVNLEPYADLLRSQIDTMQLLCDYFMRVISDTQNFSRFKHVFIKLTRFMCQIGRKFSLNVATQVLERLCILPYDDALACALMGMIEKTDPNIFNASMMGMLETQLSVNNTRLYNQLISLKQQVNVGNLLRSSNQSPCFSTPSLGQNATQSLRTDSPDTTHMDTGNNTPELGITRTVVVNRTFNNSILNNGSDSSTEDMQKNSENRWRKFSPLGCQRRVLQHKMSRTRPHKGLPFRNYGGQLTPTKQTKNMRFT